MQWFRLHNKLLNDPSVQGLSGDHFKIYINVLCYASSIDRGGYIGTLHEAAFALRETISTVTSCFNLLQGVGLIVTNETEGETFQIPQWKKKQYESDSSTERVKRHREKVKRSKTVTVTAPDTDTDTEQIQTKTLDESSINREFENLWIAYGKKGNKKTSLRKFSKLGRATRQDILSRIPDYVLSTPEKQYRKNLETYINQECWNDEVTTNETTQGLNQPRRSSVVDRVHAVNEQREQARRTEERALDGQALGSPSGDLRPPTEQPVRGDNPGELGTVIDGSFTRAD